MDDRVQTGGLSVAGTLHRFVNEEALPGTGIDPDAFWAGADAIIHDLARATELRRGATSCRPASTSSTASTRADPTRRTRGTTRRS